MRDLRLPVLVALSLFLAACAQAGAPSTSLRASEETLGSFFGWDDDIDPAVAEAERAAQEERIEAAVVACMAAEGFDYEPQVWEVEAEESWSEEAWDEDEMVATEGFGVTTWWGDEMMEEMGEEVMTEGPTGEDEWIDPNQEIIDGMGEDEFQAWQDALYGTAEEQEAMVTVEVDPETGEETEFHEGYGPGCRGEAEEAEHGAEMETWEELDRLMADMEQQVADDPRMVEATEDWSACMAERGHDFADQEALWDEGIGALEDRMDALVGPGGDDDPFDGWSEDEIDAFFTESSEDEIEAFFSEFEETQPEVDTAAIEALQQDEIDLATDDLACRDVLDVVNQEVYAEYESSFIAEHRAELEAIRDAREG
ncbi:hypothetical protein [Salsipaludibacter albus]|uniref:hypothetical protein n=1 Tax=Salsipaludibacter albus TaxID=2849650 RepID=UPI001EE4902E|nr:hypothetical protein [Salsipaludibacter albus]MBY5164154.1 hypothetical protein [Salsipaludibacter albus]